MIRAYRRLILAALALLSCGLSSLAEPSLSGSIEAIIERLYSAKGQDQLVNLTEEDIQRALTPEDKEVLATRYWSFDANVPVIVSVMRHMEQETVPFWLGEGGFTKTDMKVRNEEYEYEVWQKAFPAGHVGLGINGFDKHRQAYFVAVGAQEQGAKLELSHLYPADQKVFEMRQGATIYLDWPDLVLTEVPEALRGQVLLPTYRGRAREAHLVGAFRVTPFPSSERPDQIVLTWSADPRSSQSIQWRTNPDVTAGTVRYRPDGAGADAPWQFAEAKCQAMQDLFITNDRATHHFTATLSGLASNTRYEYCVGNTPDGAWSDSASFTTAPGSAAPFSFVFLSDTHNKSTYGELLRACVARDPKTAFCVISGDLVNTGQYRDDWDQFFAHGAEFLRDRPLAPALGNHDTIDGLGADLYLSLFALPENGTPRIGIEKAYSFTYSNALFLMLDATGDVAEQAKWLEAELARAQAMWKFAVFHFPPYPLDRDYADIQQAWCTLFDTYHVDMVFNGHVHDYVRTQPIRNGEIVKEAGQGTVYLVSVSVAGKAYSATAPPYAAKVDTAGEPLYVLLQIDGSRLTMKACDLAGTIRDEYTIEK